MGQQSLYKNHEPLIRQFSELGIWLLVVNGMVGAGIFGAPAEVARLTGIYSPLMFLLGGLLMAPVMLSFGEIASYFRGTGGPILYTHAAFGPLVSFQTGWAFYIARVAAFGANINLLVSSLAYLWEGADQGATRILLLLLVCAAMTWVNVIGAKQAMRSVGILTLLKFVPLLVLAGVGLFHLQPTAFPVQETAFPTRGDLGAAVLLLIYAFVGWESALVTAGESRNPARDMPRALLWALALVTLLYVAIQAVSVAVLPGLADSARPLVDAAASLLGPAGALLLTAGVVVSVGGNVSATMITAPRMTYTMAREGTLPAWFGAVHPRFHTPSRSVIFFGVLAFALAAYGSFAWLAGMSALTRILIYLLCIGATPRLRREFGDAPDRLRLPGGYAIPLLGMLVCVWLLAQVSLNGVLVTAGFLSIGTVLYLLVWRK